MAEIKAYDRIKRMKKFFRMFNGYQNEFYAEVTDDEKYN